MQKPSEFFTKLEAEQAELGFDVFLGDGNLNDDQNVEWWSGERIFKPKKINSMRHEDCIYRRPIPKPAPAPFVDLPIEWRPQGPTVNVLDSDSIDAFMSARPGLLHVVDDHRYRLEWYVFDDGETLTTPCDEGRLATAARFYLEVQP
jgi:hypothetical protein